MLTTHIHIAIVILNIDPIYLVNNYLHYACDALCVEMCVLIFSVQGTGRPKKRKSICNWQIECVSINKLNKDFAKRIIEQSSCVCMSCGQYSSQQTQIHQSKWSININEFNNKRILC